MEYQGYIVSSIRWLLTPEDWGHGSTTYSSNSASPPRILRLMGYYHWFIKNYAKIASPLTDLLMNEGFSWNEQADETFHVLKRAMTMVLILTLLDFTCLFELECDAIGTGLGGQSWCRGQLITFTNRVLTSQDRGISTYEKEMLAIVEAARKWRPYLIGSWFII